MPLMSKRITSCIPLYERLAMFLKLADTVQRSHGQREGAQTYGQCARYCGLSTTRAHRQDISGCWPCLSVPFLSPRFPAPEGCDDVKRVRNIPWWRSSPRLELMFIRER